MTHARDEQAVRAELCEAQAQARVAEEVARVEAAGGRALGEAQARVEQLEEAMRVSEARALVAGEASEAQAALALCGNADATLE